MTDHEIGRLNISQVIRRSLTLIARRPGVYAGLAAVPCLYMLVVAYLFTYMVVDTGLVGHSAPEMWRGLSSGAKALVLVLYLGGVLVNSGAWVATVHVTAELEAGRLLGVAKAYRRVTPKSLMSFGVLMLIGLVSGPLSVIAVPLASAFFIPAFPFAVLDGVGPVESVSRLRRHLGRGLPELIELLMILIVGFVVVEAAMFLGIFGMIRALGTLSVWVRPLVVLPNWFLLLLPIECVFVALTVARNQLSADAQ